jgi:hypothetical protein
MKKQHFASLIRVLLVLVVVASITPVSARRMRQRSPNVISRSARQHVLDATLQISMIAPNPADDSTEIVARGLGTLAHCDGGSSILTHDHWGGALEDLIKVRFSNAEGQLLEEIDAAEFKSLIRYRDGGTMVIEPPQTIAPDRPAAGADGPSSPGVAAILGDGSDVRHGDVLLVAVRQTERRDRVDTVEAKVDILDVEASFPVITLRSLDGKPIHSGDSGGGVWLNGELVGNLWSRLLFQVVSTTTVEDAVESDVMVAAVNPLEAR